jgi:hypothetical protein
LRGFHGRLQVLPVNGDAHRAFRNLGVILRACNLQVVLYSKRGIALVERDFGDHQGIGGIGHRILLRLQEIYL